ncbi:amidohydrolase family protein [Streptomyces sp. C184]|uniref:amidohydrolase family protein n=1 Tax=Streptomyces sp. C184 TaxID=3237121 RepID=UPI0034C6D5C2
MTSPEQRPSNSPGTDKRRAGKTARGDQTTENGRVDVHHHYTAPAWIDWAESKGLTRREKLPWWTHWDEETTLDVMSKAGISTSILTAAMPGSPAQDPQQRKEGLHLSLQAMSDLAQAHPRRFAFFTPVFLDDLETSSWSLRKGLDDYGAVGVSTRTSARGEYLGDPAHESLLAELNERSAVISTHPMEMPSGPVMEGLPPFMCDFLLDTTRAAINLILHGTLDRYPNLSFILPHGGGFLPYMATRLELFTHMLTPKIEPARVRDYLHRFYYDTAAPMSPSATPTLISTVDPGRILYGTDWPPTSAEIITDVVAPALDRDPALSDSQRRGINRDNALHLMPALARL